MAVITVPRPLRERLGDEASDSLVSFLNQISDSSRVDVIVLVEEKFEGRLTEESSKLRVELSGESSKLRVELSGESSKLRVELSGEISKLRVEMAETKAELVRWMFIFWMGQLVAMIGILFAFFRK